MTIEEIYNYLWNEVEGYDLTWDNDCQKLAEKLYNDGWYRRKTGVWKTDNYGMDRSVCSVCGAAFEGDSGNYCSKCGAKMEGLI